MTIHLSSIPTIQDDAPALQALLAAGKTPPHGSVYTISSTVQFSGVAVNLSGVTLRASPTAPPGMALLLLQNCTGVISGCNFDGQRQVRGNDLQCNGDLLILLGCHDLTISGNYFENSPADCLRVAAIDPTNAATACQRVRIIGNNRFNGCWRNLISHIGGAWTTIQGNHFSGAIGGQAPNAAVDVEANPGDAVGICHDIDLIANTVTNCVEGLAAMRQSVPVRIRYVGNTISGCTWGINNEADSAIITSNTLTGCGIGCDNCDDGTITANTVIAPPAGEGIYVDTNRVVNPVGHRVCGNTAPVIDVAGCGGKVVCEGNVTR